jgi:hypothetical protein
MGAVTLGGLGVLFSLGMIHVYVHLLYGLQGIDFLLLAIAFVVLISVSLATSIAPTLNATQAQVTKLLSE